MAEYYPLLAKAVGSLPNSTPETRRVVYERARKALIGQLRTLHPPVPEDDIERESVELDRAVERLERELASGGIPAPAAAQPKTTPPKTTPPETTTPKTPTDTAPAAKSAPATSAPAPKVARPASVLPEASGDAGRKPFPPRPKMPTKKTPAGEPADTAPAQAVAVTEPAGTADSALPVPAAKPIAPAAPRPAALSPSAPDIATAPGLALGRTPAAAPAGGAAPPAGPSIGDGPIRPRVDPQRPIAPQQRSRDTSRRRTYIVLAGIALIVAAVAGAAYKLRDTRQVVTQTKPAPEQVAQSDSSKISERVGGPSADTGQAPQPRGTSPAPDNSASTTPAKPSGEAAASAPATTVSPNPEVPVAHRAALLIEAPEEPNKVKTFLGTVVWKLNNTNEGPGDSVGLAVEADVDLPDDKLKAVVTFEKNTDASLPASHTIKIRFSPLPGSPTGDIKQISVPQMRPEDAPAGEALAGVTVPVVENSFLVGLSPGNAETVNIKQLKDMQWIDVPMLLSNGKIAKMTFEKGESGQRDINEAVAAWQKS